MVLEECAKVAYEALKYRDNIEERATITCLGNFRFHIHTKLLYVQSLRQWIVHLCQVVVTTHSDNTALQKQECLWLQKGQLYTNEGMLQVQMWAEEARCLRTNDSRISPCCLQREKNCFAYCQKELFIVRHPLDSQSKWDLITGREAMATGFLRTRPYGVFWKVWSLNKSVL